MATFIQGVTDVFPEPALYTPDFSFMDSMLRRRQSMYDQGFAQVNAAYNFVNRDMTHKDNIQSRDTFLKQAKENLKGLSTMDLSQAGNVQAANAVFTPFTQNENALGDAAITDWWKQQESIGEGFRNQDGGKYFNQANVDYVRKQRTAFANDAANSWKDYYQNKRAYTEYYDYNKEKEDLMRNFKPSSVKYDRIKGMYVETSENESWTNAEIKRYLEANLSDKAKQQMRIEGDVLYNNDPKLLGNIYKSSAQLQLKSFDNALSMIDYKLKGERDNDKIADLKQYQATILDRKKEVSNNIANIDKGDFAYIKKNGEVMAGNIYINQKLDQYANGYQHQSSVYKLDADHVGLEIYKQGQENMRQLRGFAHEEDMAKKKGEIALSPIDGKIVDPDNIFNFDIAAQKADDANAAADKFAVDNKKMAASWFNDVQHDSGVTVANITNEQLIKFKNEGNYGKPLPNNHPFIQNEKLGLQSKAIAEQYTSNLNAIKNQVMKNYNDAQKAEIAKQDAIIGSIGTIKLDDGTTIVGKELAAGIKSGKIVVDNTRGIYGDMTTTVKIDGKPHTYITQLDNSILQENSLASAIKKINQVHTSDAYTNFDKDVKAYTTKYGEGSVGTSNLRMFSDKSLESRQLTSQLEGYLPKSDFDVQLKGIGTDPTTQGSVYVYVTPKKDANDNVRSVDDIKAYLKAQGLSNVKELKVGEAKDASTSNGKAIMFKIDNFDNSKNSVLTAYKSLSPLQVAVAETTNYNASAGSDTGPYTSLPFYGHGNRKFQIKNDHGNKYLYVENLHGDGHMDRLENTTFTDAFDAVLYANALTAPKMIGNTMVNEAELKTLQYLINKK